MCVKWFWGRAAESGAVKSKSTNVSQFAVIIVSTHPLPQNVKAYHTEREWIRIRVGGDWFYTHLILLLWPHQECELMDAHAIVAHFGKCKNNRERRRDFGVARP